MLGTTNPTRCGTARRAIVAFAVGLPTFALLCSPAITAESTSADTQSLPNVILCMSDDQGWGDTGYQGHPHLKTPHLDQMARDGLRFERFYAAGPVCSPTRASCLSGRHPMRLGIATANHGRLDTQEVTLAEYLAARGYATGHLGKWHLGTLTTQLRDSNRGAANNDAVFSPPWQHGFNTCFSTEAKVPTWDPMLVPSAGYGRGAGASGRRPGEPYGTRYWISENRYEINNLAGDDARVIMDRVIPFIHSAAGSGRPFFAVIWFHTPHKPAVAGKEYLARYADFDEDRRHYYGCLSAMDQQIGRLRSELVELGVADNTMLWFASDNGPEGGGSAPGSTGGLRGRKRSLYEGGVRVPGLLVWPGQVEAGSVVHSPCTTSDYFPTIVDALGDDPADILLMPHDGISLLDKIRDGRTPRPSPIAAEFKRQLSLTGERYKLYSSDGGTSFELYDIQADPAENRDLAETLPDVVADMRRQLMTWRESCRRSRAGEDYARHARP